MAAAASISSKDSIFTADVHYETAVTRYREEISYLQTSLVNLNLDAIKWKDRIVEIWKAGVTEETKPELNKEFDQKIFASFMKYKKDADTTTSLLETINNAVEFCTAPALDLTTMATIAKLRAQVKQLNKDYEKYMVQGREELSKYQIEVLNLKTGFDLEIKNAKITLEPLAQRLKEKTVKTAIRGIATDWAKWSGVIDTTYMNKLIDSQKEATTAKS
jgi:hypothetical protein